MIGPRFDCKGGIAVVGRALYQFLHGVGVAVTYLPSTIEGGELRRSLYAVWSYVKFIARLVGGRYDLVHIHCSVQNSFYRKSFYMLVSALLRRRFIVHVHPERFAEFYSRSPRWVRGMIRNIFYRAGAIVVLTSSIRAKLLGLLPGANIIILANPVDCSEFDGIPDPDGNQVLFMGMISPEKGVLDLLETVPLVASRVPLVRFAFFGPVKTGFPFEEALKAAGGRNVQWRAWVSGEEKARVFQQSRMLVLPSYSEGLPNAVLEGMAASLPVVATPVGGIPDLITDGVNGFLIEPGDRSALGDRILRLLGDPDMCSRMGAMSRRLVEKDFNTLVIGRRLLGIYSRLLENSSSYLRQGT